jgi:hypothetical protein
MAVFVFCIVRPTRQGSNPFGWAALVPHLLGVLSRTSPELTPEDLLNPARHERAHLTGDLP